MKSLVEGWARPLSAASLVLLSAVTAVAQPPAGEYPYFPLDSPWTQDITNAPVDSESTTVINWLAAQSTSGGFNGAPQGWGVNQVDFTIEVLEVNSGNAGTSPFRSFTTTGDFWSPDCDHVQVPIPQGGAIEGETGYECESDGDCHLLVVYRPASLLYEMWRANIDATNTFYGGCMAVWDLRLTYPPESRGQNCSSADAAGYPIAPLLFNADEVAAGAINHAIRFVLPNNRIRDGIYVHPATHSTGPTSGPAQAPPYGTRLRLRASYPLQNLTAGAQVVAQAMQKYGILLSDGGNLAWTAQSDRFTTNKWGHGAGTVNFDINDLDRIGAGDFEMIAAGPRYNWNVPDNDCVRTTPVFNDSFELPILTKWAARWP